MPAASPAISVVVLTLNEGELLKTTVAALDDTLPADAEILVIDDGSTDGSVAALAPRPGRLEVHRTDGLGVARGRNYGAARARGQLLVFSDAHVEPPAGWWKPLAELLENPQVGAAGPGICDYHDREKRGFGMRLLDAAFTPEWLCPEYDEPMEAPLLPGGFWATRRETFASAGGLDDGMLRWGSEDFEFSLRLWMLGYELWVAPEVEVPHLFRGESPYEVEEPYPRHNELRTAFVHFSDARFARVKEALRERNNFDEGWELFASSDAPARREQVRARRVRDDDWYFEKFGAI